MQNHAGPGVDSRQTERQAASSHAISVHFGAPHAVPPGRSALATFRYGPMRPGDPEPAGGLVVDVPLVAAGSATAEIWSARGPIESGEIGGVPIARAGAVLFGVHRAPAEGVGELEHATFTAYSRILRATRGLHLYRFWNTVPRINTDESGLERYKLFCRGRSLAFERHFGERFPSYLPAASAVGSDAGDLVIVFMAGEGAPEHRENPRQVAAWAYPECYGPRSPSFARATRLPPPLGGAILLSGTASVVGHQSIHPGNTQAQVNETVRNLDALLAEGGDGRPPVVKRLKAFVRHPGDFGLVREALERAYGTNVPVLTLRADICRTELLVEIEGIAEPAG